MTTDTHCGKTITQILAESTIRQLSYHSNTQSKDSDYVRESCGTMILKPTPGVDNRVPQLPQTQLEPLAKLYQVSSEFK